LINIELTKIYYWI